MSESATLASPELAPAAGLLLGLATSRLVGFGGATLLTFGRGRGRVEIQDLFGAGNVGNAERARQNC